MIEILAGRTPLILLALLDHWRFKSVANAQSRLTLLLAALETDPEMLENETLGDRNRRLIALHGKWTGGEIRLRVVCEGCTSASEIDVPHATMLALPSAAPNAVASVTRAGRELKYRLPRMADIDAVVVNDDGLAKRAAVIERCALDGNGFPTPRLDEATIDAIETQFKALDPLSAFFIESICLQCGAATVVGVDFASVVAADIDELYAQLLRQVDVIASDYGWDEATIAALPAERRARYADFITVRRSGPQ